MSDKVLVETAMVGDGQGRSGLNRESCKVRLQKFIVELPVACSGSKRSHRINQEP